MKEPVLASAAPYSLGGVSTRDLHSPWRRSGAATDADARWVATAALAEALCLLWSQGRLLSACWPPMRLQPLINTQWSVAVSWRSGRRAIKRGKEGRRHLLFSAFSVVLSSFSESFSSCRFLTVFNSPTGFISMPESRNKSSRAARLQAAVV